MLRILFNNIRKLLKVSFQDPKKHLIQTGSWETKFCILFNFIIFGASEINCTGKVGEKENSVTGIDTTFLKPLQN